VHSSLALYDWLWYQIASTANQYRAVRAHERLPRNPKSLSLSRSSTMDPYLRTHCRARVWCRVDLAALCWPACSAAAACGRSRRAAAPRHPARNAPWPAAPIDAPCTQLLRHGDPMHAQERLTLATSLGSALASRSSVTRPLLNSAWACQRAMESTVSRPEEVTLSSMVSSVSTHLSHSRRRHRRACMPRCQQGVGPQHGGGRGGAR
jgi:hypothetical protein